MPGRRIDRMLGTLNDAVDEALLVTSAGNLVRKAIFRLVEYAEYEWRLALARHPNLMSKGSTHFDPAWFHAIIRITYASRERWMESLRIGSGPSAPEEWTSRRQQPQPEYPTIRVSPRGLRGQTTLSAVLSILAVRLIAVLPVSKDQ